MNAWRPELPPALGADAHKGDAGRVLALCGSWLMPGAAILVMRAAQRAGAGIVSLGCLDPELLALVPIAAPEGIYVDLARAGASASDSELAAALAGRNDHARLAGCGLGDSARTRALVRALLDAPEELPLVLDADALNALDGEPERLAAYRGPVVITPHPGEAARLLGRSVPRDDEGRAACARELAARARAVCCLKGARTLVAQGERVYQNDTGNPGMATAGAGDVLAGIAVAYLAAWRACAGAAERAFDAAAAAVRVHGLAGDLAARAVGRRALTASDLIAHLGPAQLALEGGEAAP